MKGQSAIEYLTTYGWMLIVVSVAGGTVYTTVDVSCNRESTGFYSESLSVENFGVNQDNSLALSLENNDFNEMTLQAVNITSDDTSRYVNLSKNVSAGESVQASVPGYELSDGCYEYDVTMIYDRGPLEGQKIQGTLRAPIAAVDLSLPTAPTNLNLYP